jgi:hypothetical protein
MATKFVSDDTDLHTSAWGELIVETRKPYHSPRKQRQPDWGALRSIDVVTVCEDPRHWKSLAARSMRGEVPAFGQLLEEFSTCLELFYSRLLTDDAALVAVDETLQSIADKFHTCDPSRPILPWLLAIATYRAQHPTTSVKPH